GTTGPAFVRATNYGACGPAPRFRANTTRSATGGAGVVARIFLGRGHRGRYREFGLVLRCSSLRSVCGDFGNMSTCTAAQAQKESRSKIAAKLLAVGGVAQKTERSLADRVGEDPDRAIGQQDVHPALMG